MIPKASSAARLKENLDARGVVLVKDDVEELDGLSKSSHVKFCWDPDTVE